jgi:hypothetical protein
VKNFSIVFYIMSYRTPSSLFDAFGISPFHILLFVLAAWVYYNYYKPNESPMTSLAMLAGQRAASSESSQYGM